MFYIVTALFVVVGSPLLIGPRRYAMAGLRAHSITSLWLLNKIVGLDFEIRGLENVPESAALFACKHQSAWETFALIPLFKDPVMLMKAELFWIPFHGWFSKKFGMIGIKREAGPAALRHMVSEARKRVEQGREIIIFPEGTRRHAEAPPDYKSGIQMLYRSLDVSCVPMALNSGLFWPRRQWMRYSGTVVVEFLEPIPPGMDKKSYMARLQNSIEEATSRLITEAKGSKKNGPHSTKSVVNT